MGIGAEVGGLQFCLGEDNIKTCSHWHPDDLLGFLWGVMVMTRLLGLGEGFGTFWWRGIALDISSFSILPAPVDHRPAADPGYSLYRSLWCGGVEICRESSKWPVQRVRSGFEKPLLVCNHWDNRSVLLFWPCNLIPPTLAQFTALVLTNHLRMGTSLQGRRASIHWRAKKAGF